ncbi:hypothetical protein FJZ55_06180, partial [Candidatus Woesearchaeota archaeon]|nr:hypothetical protein [Candidatus Woesearchaeota archaeon]
MLTLRTLLILLLLQVACCAVVSAQTWKIGVLVPLSGASAEKGEAITRSARLFVDEYNRNHQDSDIRLDLMIRDDFDDAEKARAAAAEMTRDPSVLGVMGHYHATPALATAPVFNEAGMPFLSPWVSNDDMLAANRSAFTVNVTDSDQGAYLATYLKEVLKKDKV